MEFGFWALPRPLTQHWGNGKSFVPRMQECFGEIDVAFGSTDGIPEGIKVIDRNNGYEWAKLQFTENAFRFGYWDPPYDSMYKPEALEIWRVCRKLAILHPMVYPTSWFIGARRIGMVAVTMGPLKQIRCLQVFQEKQESLFPIKGRKGGIIVQTQIEGRPSDEPVYNHKG